MTHKMVYDILKSLEYGCILFFFQAEDGIRDIGVTGVQTCALLISSRRRHTRYWRDWSSDVCSSDLTYIYSTRQLICRGAFQIHAARPIYTSIARPHVMHPSPQPPHKERVPRLNRQVVCRPLTRFQAQSAHAQVGLRGEGYQFIPHLQFFHADEAAPRNIEGMAGSDQKIDRKSTRLNSSHANISYAVFCLKKTKNYR